MKFTHKVMVFVVLLVIVFSLVGCDDPQDVGNVVNNEAALFVEDFGTAFDDSGAAAAACAMDNLLVGNRMTGQDYCD